jgi:uncharacterized membrane protein
MDFVKTFLSFDKLIGTALVKFIYFVGLVLIALACLVFMFSGFQFGFLQGLGTIVLAPILAVIYVLFWRFMSELWMVVFKISNDLAEVKKSLAGNAPQASPPAA